MLPILCDCEFVGKVANFSSPNIYPEAARADAGSPLNEYARLSERDVLSEAQR